MANATGGAEINNNAGKKSHFFLASGTTPFTDHTVAKSVEDKTDPHAIITWDVLETKSKQGGHRLRIKIQGKGLPAKLKDSPPDTGTLTVTLMTGGSSGPPVDPVPCVYVEDENP